MYYLSKIVSNTECEITDTKDGVSDIVSIDYIGEVLKSGIKIKGVSYSGVDLCLHPISDINVDVGKQKANLMGFDLNLDNGVLLGINSFPLNQGVVKIRLSNYCTTLGDYWIDGLFRNVNVRGCEIVFILDDKLKIMPHAFDIGARTRYLFFHGNRLSIKWDIRRIKSNKSRIVRCLADLYGRRLLDGSPITKYIIDDNVNRTYEILSDSLFFCLDELHCVGDNYRNLINKYGKDIIEKLGDIFVIRYKRKVTDKMHKLMSNSFCIREDSSLNLACRLSQARDLDCMKFACKSGMIDYDIWGYLKDFLDDEKYVEQLYMYVVYWHKDRELMQLWKDLIFSVRVVKEDYNVLY